jgi:hypothetical protein
VPAAAPAPNASRRRRFSIGEEGDGYSFIVVLFAGRQLRIMSRGSNVTSMSFHNS